MEKWIEIRNTLNVVILYMMSEILLPLTYVKINGLAMQRMKTIWKELSHLHSHLAKYRHVY